MDKPCGQVVRDVWWHTGVDVADRPKTESERDPFADALEPVEPRRGSDGGEQAQWAALGRGLASEFVSSASSASSSEPELEVPSPAPPRLEKGEVPWDLVPPAARARAAKRDAALSSALAGWDSAQDPKRAAVAETIRIAAAVPDGAFLRSHLDWRGFACSETALAALITATTAGQYGAAAAALFSKLNPVAR